MIAVRLAPFFRTFRVVLPAVIFFVAVILMATVGYEILGYSFTDAIYMVAITVFGVGYGEVHPVDTVPEKIFTISVIVLGSLALVLILGGITKAVTEGELTRFSEESKKKYQMNSLHNHAIICGYGRMGQTLARELATASFPFIVIDRDEERIEAAERDGFLALRGDATDETILQTAGIERAHILATVLPQDALNVFITLTARDASRSIRIIARGEQVSTEKKLMQAGANEVILPAIIGAQRIAHSITRPTVMELLGGNRDTDWHALGLEIDELKLKQHAHWCGQTVGTLHKQGAGVLFVLAVRHENGEIQTERLDEIVLREGDALIVLGRHWQLAPALGSHVQKTELL